MSIPGFTADDSAPAASKTKWLAIFYLCIPTGYALGYIFGGLVAVPLGWRAPFLLEAVAMVPFVIFCCVAPPIDIKGTKEQGEMLLLLLHCKARNIILVGIGSSSLIVLDSECCRSAKL
jgi:MFS family permease